MRPTAMVPRRTLLGSEKPAWPWLEARVRPTAEEVNAALRQLAIPAVTGRGR